MQSTIRCASRGLLVVSCLLLVSGCTKGTPKGYVAKQWSLTMREMGINPVFPPREDVQVGDVYVYPVVPGTEDEYIKKNDYLPLDLWVATVNLEEKGPGTSKVSAFYAGRPAFPVTPAAGAPPPAATGDVFCSGEVGRLRKVGFPVFLATTFSQGDLSAVVPIQALNVAFGTNYNSEKNITLRIPNAESYALPADRIRELLLNGTGDTPQEPAPAWLNGDLLWKYAPASARAQKKAYFIVITEVYYAREIELSIQDKSAKGVALAAELAAPGARLLQPGDTSAAGSGGASETTPAAATTTDVWNPVALANQLNSQLDRMEKMPVPGGDLKFVSVTRSSVAMKATFERPMAIGYRGFFLAVTEESTGDHQPSLAGVVSTSIPTVKSAPTPGK